MATRPTLRLDDDNNVVAICLFLAILQYEVILKPGIHWHGFFHPSFIISIVSMKNGVRRHLLLPYFSYFKKKNKAFKIVQIFVE